MLARLGIALLLGSAAQTEEDVSKIDQPAPSRSEADAALLERHTTLRLENAPVLRIPRGQTAFIEVEVTLLKPPKGAIDLRLTDQKTARGISFASFVEITSPAEKGRPKISALYALRVSATAKEGSHEISAALGAYDLAGGSKGANALLGRKSIAHTIDVTAPSLDLASIELDRKAYLYHQGLAAEAHSKLGTLKAILSLDQIDPPPPPGRVADKDAARVVAFLHHRLRADIALERLRLASAEPPNPELASAALRALGSLTRRASGAAARASAIEGKSAAEALAFVESLLNDARIDEAEGALTKLRNSGKLTKDQLTKALVLIGGVESARGKDADAKRAFNQALCLDPNLNASFRHALMQRRFDEAKAAPGRCQRPTTVEGVTAYRAPFGDGVGFLIRAAFGPDPDHLVAGGDIEIWGTGGGRYRTDKVRADPASGGRIEARSPDPGGIENYKGDLLVKVLLRDVSGVVIATFGEPDPTPVALGRLEGAGEPLLPLWVWIVLGGIAVAGATSAVVIARSSQKTKQGLGPFSVEF